jgi:hypothetical protein
MNITRILQEAILPGRILAVQVGLTRTAVLAEAEDGIRCGLAATLANPEFEHPHQPAVHCAGHLQEMDCTELAALVESTSYTETSIGLAAINALLPRKPELWVDLNAEDYLIQNCAGKNVAIIGHFPFINRLKPHVKNLWVLELNPRDGDLPAQAAPEFVPQADFVAITGTTLINKTFDGLIPLCRPGATVVMLGPSTPLSPILFDFGISIVSSTIVDDPQATALGVAQGISLQQLRQTGCVRFVTMQRER